MPGESTRPPLQRFFLRLDRRTVIASLPLLDNRDHLFFSSIPEPIVVSKQANYGDEFIPGRSEPWKVYGYSTSTQITFTGILYAQGKLTDRVNRIPGLGRGLGLAGRLVPDTAPFLGIAGNAASLIRSQFTNPEELIEAIVKEVHERAAWLEALTYPQYDRLNRAFPPPVVDICFGSNFLRTGVLKSFNFTYKGPWELNTLLTYGLEADLVFDEVNLRPKGYTDVRDRKFKKGLAPAKANILKTLGGDAISLARSKIGL